jgi:hypothetical protein
MGWRNFSYYLHFSRYTTIIHKIIHIMDKSLFPIYLRDEKSLYYFKFTSSQIFTQVVFIITKKSNYISTEVKDLTGTDKQFDVKEYFNKYKSIDETEYLAKIKELFNYYDRIRAKIGI